MRTLITATVGVACLLMAAPAVAGNARKVSCYRQVACAPQCCKACGQKSCRVICEMKKIKRTVWVVKCEEFCVPMPRLPKCFCTKRCGPTSCGATCETCGSCAGQKSCCKKRPLVPPRCGPVRCRKKLVKKTIVCEVPVYKCVVCGACCDACCPCDEMPPAAPVKKVKGKQALLPAPMPVSRNPRLRAPL